MSFPVQHIRYNYRLLLLSRSAANSFTKIDPLAGRFTLEGAEEQLCFGARGFGNGGGEFILPNIEACPVYGG